ncbi:BC1872 family protein [Paenibacillus naphthalenovorans]|uniref:BC1872 family protein n=1 Tax=Paenibacillus naphthalenovorans TaxID=162209 RepID=UPI00088BD9D1|nr:hypothetical protein [Paenibacillus naphthalenovorans]SDJ62085.1 hypothetical protein SAMN05421868_13466 [Paenibacillus naphthalenovorans]
MTLSREEILAMPSGRELDALVAEKVMGWNVKFMGDILWGWMYSETERNRWYNVPKFSADISAAWKAVEKMKRNDWVFVINSISEEWTALFYLDRIHEHEVTCNSAPEAICKAALLAIMNGGDNQ